MPLTLAGFDVLDRLFCFALSELHAAFPPPRDYLIEERAQLENRVANLASSADFGETELARKLQDLEARGAKRLDHGTADALREIYRFPSTVLRGILRDHGTPISMIKAQLELVIEDLLATGAIARDEILKRLDPLKAHGGQRVYLYQVPVSEIGRLKAVESMDIAVWKAYLPQLTAVVHPSDGEGEHVFKLVHTRIWHENVESGPNQITAVPHEERGLDFLRVDEPRGIAQIRVQLMKAGAETTIKDELELARREIGKLVDIDTFRPLPLGPVIRQWLRETPAELVVSNWKVWTGGKEYVLRKGSPDSFQTSGTFFDDNRPAFLSGTWVCVQGGKLQIELNADDNYVEVGGKCRRDQLAALLDHIASDASALQDNRGNRVAGTGVGSRVGRHDLPPGVPDGTFLEWVRQVIEMAIQRDQTSSTKPDKLKYRYALAGLVAGTGFMICGLVLLLNGIVGHTNFTATVLGAQTNLTDAQTGTVFAVLGFLVILTTRYTTK